jgi:hypothetical protein
MSWTVNKAGRYESAGNLRFVHKAAARTLSSLSNNPRPLGPGLGRVQIVGGQAPKPPSIVCKEPVIIAPCGPAT